MYSTGGHRYQKNTTLPYTGQNNRSSRELFELASSYMVTLLLDEFEQLFFPKFEFDEQLFPALERDLLGRSGLQQHETLSDYAMQEALKRCSENNFRDAMCPTNEISVNYGIAKLIVCARTKDFDRLSENVRMVLKASPRILS